METMLVQKLHGYIYSHTRKLKRSLRTGSTGELGVSWWHLHGFCESQLGNSSEPKIRNLTGFEWALLHLPSKCS